MRKAYISAVLLVLALLVYVMLPDRRDDGANSLGNGTVHGRRQHKSSHDDETNAEKHSASENKFAAHRLPGDYPNATAAVQISSSALGDSLAAKARELGISVRWIPALRIIMLHGRDDAVRRLLADAAFKDFEVEYNIQLRMIPEKESHNIIGPSGRPFLDSHLEWLGIDSKQESRGKGVKIAILDTAIDLSSISSANITTFDLFGLEREPGSHGTMVASIIVGEADRIEGIANGASILSIPVMDSEGNGYVFNLAEAIVAAADAGVDIISMSVTCQYESSVLRSAVEYALSKGCVLVAAAGNEGVSADGMSTVGYPAAFDGVISVGAVNADGARAGFSSTGEELALMAPGVGIIADNGDGYALFSGTSAAAPLAAGTIAYVKGKIDGTATHAATLLLELANDAGMPGPDDEYGLGNINAERALNYDMEGYNDFAAADIVSKTDEDGHSAVYFSAQNRGNDDLATAELLCILHLSDGETCTKTMKFQDVKQNQTVSVKIDLPEGVTALYAEMTATSPSDDSVKANNYMEKILFTRMP